MENEPVPVAAPLPTVTLLTGPPRPVRVAAVTPAAVYLATGQTATPALCLASREAVRLPCTLVIAPDRADRPFAGWRVGQLGAAGDGGVRVGGRWWPVTRWWRPSRIDWRPARADPTAGPPGARPVAATLAAQVPDPLDARTRLAVDRLTSVLRAGADPAPATRALLGRGPGLTPLGDDVLAGMMLTIRAFGVASARPLAGAVTGAAPAHTTFVSAALLAHAARGECVAEVADLLHAVVGGMFGPVLARAASAVAAIGHSSGAGLVHGVLAGLAVAAPRPKRWAPRATPPAPPPTPPACHLGVPG